MAFMASGEQHGYSHDAEDTQPPRGGGRRARRRSSRRLSWVSLAFSLTLFAGVAAIALLDIDPFGDETVQTHPGVTAYNAPSTPAIDALGERLTARPDIWTQIPDAEPLYRMRSLELVDLPASYEAREHGRGGRLDLLSFGDFASAGLHLHLVVYRMGEEAPPPSTLFVDLARRGAESGVGVISLGNTLTQDTKFGIAEVAGAELSFGGRERACQVYRLNVADQTTLQLLGWTCDDEPVTAPEIACFIDHLALTEVANDTALTRLFDSAAQRQLPECGAVPLPVGPEGI